MLLYPCSQIIVYHANETSRALPQEQNNSTPYILKEEDYDSYIPTSLFPRRYTWRQEEDQEKVRLIGLLANRNNTLEEAIAHVDVAATLIYDDICDLIQQQKRTDIRLKKEYNSPEGIRSVLSHEQNEQLWINTRGWLERGSLWPIRDLCRERCTYMER